MAKEVRKTKNPFLKKKTLHILGLLLLIPVTLYLLQQTFSFFQQAEETTHIQIQPDQTVLRNGQSASLNIVSSSQKELLTAITLTISYPASKLDITSVDTSQSSFKTAEVTEQSPGTITFNVKSPEPMLGNNLIAQIQITAKDLVDTQEITALENAQATTNTDGQELTTTIPVTTVYGDNIEAFNKKSSVIQSLINSLLETFQKILPGSSST